VTVILSVVDARVFSKLGTCTWIKCNDGDFTVRGVA
jgi:hypothetical protein